jgi:hypothetical protein
MTDTNAAHSRLLCHAQGVKRIGACCAPRRQRAREQSHDEGQQRDGDVHARIASTDSEELRREQAADGQSRGCPPDDADYGHAQALSEDEPDQVARLRPDSGTDAEFLPALCDRVADEPVETDRCQDESGDGERGNHVAGQLLRARAGRDDVAGGSDVDDGEGAM